MPCRAVIVPVFGAQANDMGGTLVRTIGRVQVQVQVQAKAKARIEGIA